MSLYRGIRDAIQAVWTAHWPRAAGAPPVLWHRNEMPLVPDAGTVAQWVLVSIEFGQDVVAAYGAGRLANERRQAGSVVVRIFTAVGAGEDAALDLMSDAVAALRSRRDGALSFIGSVTGIDEGGTEDGAWHQRAAVIAFEFRHAG
jgi:hypothetical protein